MWNYLYSLYIYFLFFFFQAEDGIRDRDVTGVQTCALPIYVRELLDGRVVVLHDEVIRGEAPSPGPTFILKPRRAPSGDRRPRRVGRARPLPQRLPRLAPNTHTGRRPLATHPWRRAQAAAIRLHEARTGRTFSRRSDGGPNH